MITGVSAPMGFGFSFDSKPQDDIPDPSAMMAQQRKSMVNLPISKSSDKSSKDKKTKEKKTKEKKTKEKKTKEKKVKDPKSSSSSSKNQFGRIFGIGTKSSKTPPLNARHSVLHGSVPDLRSDRFPPPSPTHPGHQSLSAQSADARLSVSDLNFTIYQDDDADADADPFAASLSADIKAVHLSLSAMMEETSIFQRDSPLPSHRTLPVSFDSLHSAIPIDCESTQGLSDDDSLDDPLDTPPSSSSFFSPAPTAGAPMGFTPSEISASAQGLFAFLPPEPLPASPSPSRASQPSPRPAAATLSPPPLPTSQSSTSVTSFSAANTPPTNKKLHALTLIGRNNSSASLSAAMLPPPSLPQDTLAHVQRREQVRADYLAAPSPQTAPQYLALFTDPEEDHSVLRKTLSRSLSPADIEGMIFEKMVYFAASCEDPSVFMALHTAGARDFSSLSACLAALTCLDIALCAYRSAFSPEDLLGFVTLLWQLPACHRPIHDFLFVWISIFDHDFHTRTPLLERLNAFVVADLSKLAEPRPEHTILPLIVRAMRGELPPVAPQPVRSNSTISSWSTMSPKQLAEGITYHDFQVFSLISPKELLVWPYLTKEEKSSQAPNITAMVAQFNYWHYFTATHILKFREPPQRMKALMAAIALALALKKANNVSGLTAVISALTTTPIARLKATWALLPSKYHKVFTTLSKFISSQSNFGAIRRHLLECSLPAIPHIGLLMQDITFIRENADFLPFQSAETDLFNLKKATLTAKTVASLCYFQKSSYKPTFIPPEDLSLLRSNPVLRPDLLQKLSEKLETSVRTSTIARPV